MPDGSEVTVAGGSHEGLIDVEAQDRWGQSDVPISAIEHYSYCPRQCALIHIEQTYHENAYTVRGNLMPPIAQVGRSGSVELLRLARRTNNASSSQYSSAESVKSISKCS